MACWVTSKQANTTNLNTLLVCLVAQSSALEMKVQSPSATYGYIS